MFFLSEVWVQNPVVTIDLMFLRTSYKLFELISKPFVFIYNKIHSNPINVLDLGL